MKKGMVISGILLMIAAVILALVLIIPGVMSFKDPRSDNVAEISSGDSIELEKGSYNIWSEDQPENIEIHGPSEVDVKDISTDVEFMEVKMYYIFEIEEEGEYTFTYTGNEDIIITEDYTSAIYIILVPTGCCCGGIIFLIGLILMIIGFFVGKKRK